MTAPYRGTGNRHRCRIAARRGIIACAAALGAAVALPASAHHSFAAEFDSSREIKVTGEVSDVEWQNPHAWIHVGVQEICERPGRPRGSDAPEQPWSCRTPGADEPAVWGFELGSPNGLMRLGWNRNSLSAGDKVTVEGTRARDDSQNANARNVTTDDGTRLFAGSSEREGR